MSDTTREQADDLYWRLSREQAIDKMYEALLGLKWIVDQRSADRIDALLKEIKESLNEQ